MNIALTLCMLVPKAEYYGVIEEETEVAYNAISWRDTRPKPLWQDIVDNSALAETLYWRHSTTVTPLQLIRGLIITDEYDLVVAFLDAAGPDVKISWERAVEIPRMDAFVGQMLQLLEKTEEEADMLFALALTL